jgi:hypothetical protein
MAGCFNGGILNHLVTVLRTFDDLTTKYPALWGGLYIGWSPASNSEAGKAQFEGRAYRGEDASGLYNALQRVNDLTPRNFPHPTPP